jgi:hypothetical protein
MTDRAGRAVIARKCFNGRRILRLTEPRLAPSDLSASINATFRFVESSTGGELPSVCRNVPEVCRKTSPAQRSQPGMSLKPFNRRRFSSASESGFSAQSPISAP